MAPFPKKMSELCTPALVYFVISVIGFLMCILQNLGNTSRYHLGSYSCPVPSTLMVFILKAIYILFWTWVLNLICKSGHKEISWLLVLLPFILLFVIMGMMMISK
jgi:hypothetical protein